jgi:hypothetical protein
MEMSPEEETLHGKKVAQTNQDFANLGWRRSNIETRSEYPYWNENTKHDWIENALKNKDAEMLWQPLVIACMLHQVLTAKDPIKETESIINSLTPEIHKIVQSSIPIIAAHELPDVIFRLLEKVKERAAQVEKEK